ncbi:GNAT family N-acetyltransferase [Grimontia sp. NTOU-MAR1]|uniref:GNAT family N-acetyltransferase n=1 Tax=Grimontia sp. NTOU-MAR1 TaxID=3111011 RepID=UPI002DBC8F55|nr:GNAT family N-acetyltransferase [Grimontia sp. NTOU-MAR1]WRW00089.1 GNAT family N-acetyltransferase [Grimontia sp. NTOU-MAR1]
MKLQNITGDSGQNSFSADDFDPDKDGCIVVYVNKIAVACGVFRYYEPNTCEFKRMYSKYVGAGGFLLSQLEFEAFNRGYTKVLLSTRRVNTQAVRFYLHNSFNEIEAFGRYVGIEKSICFGKQLFT